MRLSVVVQTRRVGRRDALHAELALHARHVGKPAPDPSRKAYFHTRPRFVPVRMKTPAGLAKAGKNRRHAGRFPPLNHPKIASGSLEPTGHDGGKAGTNRGKPERAAARKKHCSQRNTAAGVSSSWPCEVGLAPGRRCDRESPSARESRPSWRGPFRVGPPRPRRRFLRLAGPDG